MILRTILIALSALLLAAHFLRWGQTPLVILSLVFPLLLLIHKRWALLTVQALTVSGAVVWLLATYQFVAYRMAVGEPWMRLVVILGTVVALTITAALLLSSASVRARYPRSSASLQ